MLAQCPATFKADAKMAALVGTILAHTRYGKGLKKPKSKGKNPYYIPYYCTDVVVGDAGPIPMELSKTTLKC